MLCTCSVAMNFESWISELDLIEVHSAISKHPFATRYTPRIHLLDTAPQKFTPSLVQSDCDCPFHFRDATAPDLAEWPRWKFLKYCNTIRRIWGTKFDPVSRRWNDSRASEDCRIECSILIVIDTMNKCRTVKCRRNSRSSPKCLLWKSKQLDHNHVRHNVVCSTVIAGEQSSQTEWKEERLREVLHRGAAQRRHETDSRRLPSYLHQQAWRT